MQQVPQPQLQPQLLFSLIHLPLKMTQIDLSFNISLLIVLKNCLWVSTVTVLSSPGKPFTQTSDPPPNRTTANFIHTNNSLNLYLFLNSELLLGTSKEFNNQGMKIQFKRAFKNYKCLSSKNKKVGKLNIKFSSTSNTMYNRCLNLSCIIDAHLFSCPLFSKNISTLRLGSRKW